MNREISLIQPYNNKTRILLKVEILILFFVNSRNIATFADIYN